VGGYDIVELSDQHNTYNTSKKGRDPNSIQIRDTRVRAFNILFQRFLYAMAFLYLYMCVIIMDCMLFISE